MVLHHLVHTNRPNAPISKYFSTDVSLLNIDCWISKIYISIVNKILHLRAVPGVEFVISIPETCSLYTCIEYNDMTQHNTLLTQICDVLLTHANILLSCQQLLNICFSCTASSISSPSWPYTYEVQSSMYSWISSRTWSACLRSLIASRDFCLISTLFVPTSHTLLWIGLNWKHQP